jgi:hypothetical protein
VRTSQFFKSLLSLGILFILNGCIEKETLISVQKDDNHHKESNLRLNATVNNESTNEYYKYGKLELVVLSSGILKSEFISADVKVPDGFVLVGGGVYCSTWATNYGPFISSSYPLSDLKTWRGKAFRGDPGYKIEAAVWAIGIKIDGVSESELRNNIVIFTSSSTSDKLSISTTAKVSDSHILLGGGVNNSFEIAASISDNNNSWYVQSLRLAKSLGNRTIEAYAIGLSKSFAKKYKLSVSYNHWDEFREHKYSGGTSSFKISPDTGYRIINCGAYEITNTSRGIVSQYPFLLDNIGIMATTAKYNKANNGRSRMVAIGIKVE